MRVFLTGATGYIGRAVAETLKQRGHALTGLARNDEAAKKLAGLGVAPVRGDLFDSGAIGSAARAADAVIHMATTNGPDFPEADRAAVDAILAALSGSGKPFIYTSGIWVLGRTGDIPADEDTPASPLPIVAWRPAHEKRVREAAAQGVKAMVLRPGIVYGRGGGIPAMLTAREGVVRFVGEGGQHWPTVHVDDLADLYAKVLEQGGAGNVYHGISGEVQVRQAAEASARSGGRRAAVSAWPVEEARRTLGPFAEALAADQRITAAKTLKALGWNPTRPGILEDLENGSYARA
jgi:nucleoside-diphosphate-sugar epimerase